MILQVVSRYIEYHQSADRCLLRNLHPEGEMTFLSDPRMLTDITHMIYFTSEEKQSLCCQMLLTRLRLNISHFDEEAKHRFHTPPLLPVLCQQTVCC